MLFVFLHNNWWAAVRGPTKTNAPFTSDRDAVLAAIVRKEGGIVYHGIEGNALTRLFGRMMQRLIDTTRPVRQHLGLSRSTFEGLPTSKSRSK